MEIEEQQKEQFESKKNIWTTVTPLSKYLALALFVALPFVGGWVGYHYAPEKIVEVEKVVEVEGVAEAEDKNVTEKQNVFVGTSSWEIYENEILDVRFKYPNSFKIKTEDSTAVYFVLDVDRKEYCNNDPACSLPSLTVRRISEETVDGYIQKLNQKDTRGNDTVIVTKSSAVNGKNTKWGYMLGMIDSLFVVMEQTQDSILEITLTGAGVLHFENVVGRETLSLNKESDMPVLIFDAYNFEDIVKSVADNVILHPECSDENPPRIYSMGKMMNNELDLCGNKTGFSAREFINENFILFVVSDISEGGNKIRTLKTISTIPPFDEVVLGNFTNVGFTLDGSYVDDVFVHSVYGDGPGSLGNIFIFKPATKDYIIANSRGSNFGDIRISVAGSVSKTEYFAEYISEKSQLADTPYNLRDEDIQLTINEKTFTKKDITEGKGEAYLNVFNCNFQDLGSYKEKPEQYQQRIEEYLKYFPSKVPCYENSFTENRKPFGFVDLMSNEFVTN